MKSVSQFCREVMGFRDESAIERLVPHLHRRYLPAKSLLAPMGEPIREVYILAEGLVVASTLDESGDYRVECIENRPGTVCLDINILNAGMVSTLNIRAGMPSVFYVIAADRLWEFLKTEPDASRVYTSVLAKALHRNWNMQRALTGGSAAERYQWFLQEFPGAEAELPDRVIASYLNMNPVTLSRIRSAMLNPGGGVNLPAV